MIIHHLVVDDSTDELVMNALKEKSGTQEALLSALKAKIKEVKNGDFKT